MTPGILPALNATLNFTSGVLLAAGFFFIRRRNKAAHVKCMVGAFLTSVIFLVCYLAYHYQAGSVRFTKTGWIRPVYFSILISHTILAVFVVPLALRTLHLALRGNFEKHKAAARLALPIWLYVSATGVIVYWMLYRL